MSNEQFITDTIEQARVAWGLDEQWKFTWQYSDLGGVGNAEIDPSYFTEKHALISIDPETTDKERLKLDIYHELGHVVLSPIWLGATDWADHTIKSKKARAIWEEQFNTRENEVLDFLIKMVLKV